MTKPTGRPRGRPKTKAYVTLMARVDSTLADQVKRYASVHRQPISVVIRDALALLMEEYPCAGDRATPQRLAAHEFLADRYASPLDTLIGETDSVEREALLSDRHEAVIETVLSDTHGEDSYVSDTKAAISDKTSDKNTESTTTQRERPAHARSHKASDRKTASHKVSDTKAGKSSMVSDMQEGAPASRPEPVLLSDTPMPTFDTHTYRLGKLCPREHGYEETGQSLRYRGSKRCIQCETEAAKERRRATRVCVAEEGSPGRPPETKSAARPRAKPRLAVSHALLEGTHAPTPGYAKSSPAPLLRAGLRNEAACSYQGWCQYK